MLVEVSLMTNRRYKILIFELKISFCREPLKFAERFVPQSFLFHSRFLFLYSLHLRSQFRGGLDFCAIIERFPYMFFHVSSRTIYLDKGDSLQEAIYTTLSLVDHNHYTLLVETCLIILIYGR